MSVIIRLQNLAWSANASDIREFFKGLNVPEGGVHIVGGEMGDAFIAFSTDEDARLGMMKSGEVLKGVQVTLSLSSRTQMQKIIEAARNQVMAPTYPVTVQPVPVPAQQPLPFNQPNPPVAPAPIMQSIPQSQPQVQQEQKPESMYRTETAPMQNFAPQQQFGSQPPQYPAMFPGAPVMKPAGNGTNNYPVRPVQPASQMEGKYFQPQIEQPLNTPKQPFVEEKEKVQTISNDKQNSEIDKRDRRNDYSRDRKDRESRDERRRRSKSRSRSRSRERRRRHRSRSRERSSRYRRSRSRDRDRGKDKDRRDKDKRTPRDHREGRSQESTESKSSQPARDGIPGLGDIPAEIPKDKIKIVSEAPNEPVTRTPHTRWGAVEFAKSKEQDTRQTVDMEIETVDMEIEKVTQDGHQSPIQQPPPFLRQPPPVIRQPLNRQQPPQEQVLPLVRQPTDQLPPPQERFPHPSQNGRSGMLQPPMLNAGNNFEGPRFTTSANVESFHPSVGSNERRFDSERRGYDGTFEDVQRNGPNADGSYAGREEWPQRNLQHSMRPQRPGGSWNNNDYDPRNAPMNFERPPPDGKMDEREFWNNRGPSAEAHGQVGYNDRPGQRRFPEQDFYRSSDNNNSYERGRQGNDGETGRPDGQFFDQEDYRERGTAGRGGSYRGRGMGSSGPPEAVRDRKTKTTCVELLNVPINSSYKSIRDLFYGIPIPNTTIKILPDEEGNRTTTALMRFGTTMDATEAFKRRSSYIGNSMISINFVDEMRYDNSSDFNDFLPGPRRRYQEGAPLSRNCIKITGLPQACTDSDIGQIFAEFRIGNIVIERNTITGDLLGCSYVSFSSDQEAGNALRKLQGVTLDGNFLKGELCHENILISIMETQQRRGYSEGNKPQINEPRIETRQVPEEPNRSEAKAVNRPNVDLLTDSVVIKLVPFDLPKSSIHDFFSDEGIVPERIYFTEANSDKLSDVYVVFPLVENAPKAVSKSGQMLGPVKASIELISKPTVMRVLGLPFDPLELFKKSNKSAMVDNSKIQHQRDNEVVPPPLRGSEVRPSPRRPPQDDRRYFHPGMNANNNDRQESNFQHEPRPRDRSSYPSRPSYPEQEHSKSVPNSVAPDHFGRPGSVVALGNVPYSATTDDILQFFRGFPNITPDCIIRRYDEMNRPTADARVSMGNNEDAMRAINTLHRQYMMNRSVYVTLVAN